MLTPDDPPAFKVENAQGRSPVVLACDHASHTIPHALNGLGLGEAELQRHIGWDEGAASVTRGLSARLDARAVLAGFSRLVIDCNRDPSHETSIATESDGTTVPGNQDLDRATREARQHAVFEPYHAALGAALDAVQAGGTTPSLIAVHSFTPEMDGKARPWHITVLWADDGRIPLPLMDALRAHDGLVVGDNVPYSGKEQYGYTMDVHAAARGIPHALIEIRADQILDAAGVARYVALLGDALESVLAGVAPD